MAIHKPEGGLSADEKKIVKALLNRRMRNQDIQALINSGGRKATINSARITGVKQNSTIAPASDQEVERFIKRKKSFDPATGLNLFEDERLIRSREAMILAVQVFNGPSFKFKTELFAVLANIAWTYLLHEFYLRKGLKIIAKDGRSLPLVQMLERQDCPLSKGVKQNLKTIKEVRDEVEHLLLGQSDGRWAPLFQACCLNFDNALRRLFGNETSLQNELTFALQFSKLDMDHVTTIQGYDIPEQIAALDARVKNGLSDEDLADIEYQFQVIYTLDSATKSRAHFQFLQPGSEQAGEVRNVLQKYKIADDAYPFKPNQIPRIVKGKTGKNFTTHNHVQAWKLYKVRPKSNAKDRGATDKEFCIYHVAHGDYTYSQKWIDRLIASVQSDDEFAKIKAVSN